MSATVTTTSFETQYLQPGQITVGEGFHVLTILGSCVAVCLVDRVRGVGGINHYLLPRGPRGSESPRFGDVALPQLLQQMLVRGARRESLEAKLFGGARVLAATSASRDLGAENVAAALEFLKKEDLPIVARNTGGDRGRKLVFQTSDGVVWVKTF
jgi:chemotaxis protein CheD